jgi:uncharacterized cupredoxin-like copper-binding protein
MALAAVQAAMLAALLVGCSAEPSAPASIQPGTAEAPREVNVIASDYAFVPAIVRVVAGETVLIHVVNGGLEPHEAVIGDMAVQVAWEEAQARTVGHPPGPTPAVSVHPSQAGIRVFVASGQRVDVRWTVPARPPADASADGGGWFVGCHIPGHFEKGMVVPIEFIDPADAAPGGG